MTHASQDVFKLKKITKAKETDKKRALGSTQSPIFAMARLKDETDKKKISHPEGQKIFAWYHPDFLTDRSTLKIGLPT